MESYKVEIASKVYSTMICDRFHGDRESQWSFFDPYYTLQDPIATKSVLLVKNDDQTKENGGRGRARNRNIWFHRSGGGGW